MPDGKGGINPIEIRTSDTIEKLTVRIQRMPYCGYTVGSLLAAAFGDGAKGREKAHSFCQLMVVAALDGLLDPGDEILEAMLGRSHVPNKVLARALFRSGIQGALGQFLPPVRQPSSPLEAQPVSGALR